MKKRKTYNKMKQLQRVGDHLLKDIAVAYCDRLKGCVILDTKRLRLVPPDSREGKQKIAALGRPMLWACSIYALGFDGKQEYFKSECIKATSRYYQDALAPLFEEHHGKLAKEMNPSHLAGLAWLASPLGYEFSDEEASELLTALQAWG